jgi:hypothetical protein
MHREEFQDAYCSKNTVRMKEVGHVADIKAEKHTNFGQRRSSKETIWKTYAKMGENDC